MDFEKIKESCEKIRMPSDMKKRLKEKCNAAEAPERNISRQCQFDVRLVMACVCCLLIVLGIGLKYGNILEKKPPIAEETTQTQNTETTLFEFLTDAESTVIQIVETVAESSRQEETTVTQTQSSTDEPIVSQLETTRKGYVDSEDVQGAQLCSLDMRDRDKLKRAKAAAETMSEEEYREFLNENEYWDVSGCFCFPEEYLAFTESDLYIPVVDEGVAEILWMDYTPGYGRIDVGISFDERNAFRFYIDISGKRETYFRDYSYMYRYKKTFQKGNITADIFKTKLIYREDRAWEGLAVDLIVDGQEMAVRTATEMRDENFEKYFEQIKFVKIKDWI